MFNHLLKKKKHKVTTLVENTTIYDASKSAKTVSLHSGASITNTYVRNGGNSLRMLGYAWLSLAGSSDWALGTTATLEMWICPNSSQQANARLFCVTNGYTNYSAIDSAINNSGTLLALFHNNYTTPFNILANVWSHIAWVFNAGNLTIYVNGVLETIIGATSGYNITNAGSLYISSYMGGGYNFTGGMDDLRITKGIARYQSNFTPPQNLPSDSSDPYWNNTVLLIQATKMVTA
jgi:hypothetical protein